MGTEVGGGRNPAAFCVEVYRVPLFRQFLCELVDYPTGHFRQDFPAGRWLAPPAAGRAAEAGPDRHRVKSSIASCRFLRQQRNVGAP